ncbi:hypothetical protein T12_14615 [Trichinella patagoniensis]|uniref:Uncharacterized protein n=1 Tax=Trichinella patagoniensis TaxID=990121 RepID=A0A0V0ZR07_9BILA|nr:hypothetical protein T12_14615 [Trichinella patagoniensis]
MSPIHTCVQSTFVQVVNFVTDPQAYTNGNIELLYLNLILVEVNGKITDDRIDHLLINTQVFSGLTAAEWAFRETSVGLIVLSGPLPDGYAKVEPLLTACRSSLQG